MSSAIKKTRPQLAEWLENTFKAEKRAAKAEGYTLTQQRFAAKLGLSELSGQNFSKFIHGRLSEIPEGLPGKLQKHYDLSDAELEELVSSRVPVESRGDQEDDDSQAEPVLVRILSTHTLWAGSLVQAALSGQIPRFQVATQIDDSDAAMPRWIEPLAQHPNGDGSSPAETPEQAASSRSIPPFAPKGTMETAGQVMARFDEHKKPLNDEANSVVFAAIPLEVVEDAGNRSRRDRFRRVASLLGAGRISLLVSAKDERWDKDSTMISTESFVKKLKPKEDETLTILAQPNSVAMNRANWIKELADKLYPNQPIRIQDRAISVLQEATWEELVKDTPGLVAVLAWEPWASWFVARCGKDVVRSLPLFHYPRPGQPPQPITFDLFAYVPRGGHDPEAQQLLQRALGRLLGEIVPMLQEVGDWIIESASSNASAALEALGGHFNLVPKGKPTSASQVDADLCELFGSLRFRAFPDMVKLRDLQFPIHRIAELAGDD